MIKLILIATAMLICANAQASKEEAVIAIVTTLLLSADKKVSCDFPFIFDAALSKCVIQPCPELKQGEKSKPCPPIVKRNMLPNKAI